MNYFCSKSALVHCRDHLHYEHDSGLTWFMKRDACVLYIFIVNLKKKLHSSSLGTSWILMGFKHFDIGIVLEQILFKI
jgi:hypothetical protein